MMKGIRKYSRKAQEKFADHLIQLANMLIAGLLATVLIAPFAAIFKMLFEPEGSGASVWAVILKVSFLEFLIFVVAYWVVIWFAVSARTTAMQIYTELYPDAS